MLAWKSGHYSTVDTFSYSHIIKDMLLFPTAFLLMAEGPGEQVCLKSGGTKLQWRT